MRRVVYWSLIAVIIMVGGALMVAPAPWEIGLSGVPAAAWATDSAPTEGAMDESPATRRLPDSLEGDPEAIALGERTFHTYCWGCHGRNGTGAQCPDFSDNRQIHGDGYADLVEVVTNGVKGTPMGPWGYALGRERLLQVVAYVFSLKGTRQLPRR